MRPLAKRERAREGNREESCKKKKYSRRTANDAERDRERGEGGREGGREGERASGRVPTHDRPGMKGVAEEWTTRPARREVWRCTRWRRTDGGVRHGRDISWLSLY